TEITKCLIKDYLKSHIDNLIVIEKNYQQKFINIDDEQKNILSMQSHMTMMQLSKQILVKQKVFLYLMKKIMIIF
ncbi:potassium channel protein, partial [Francisella tularensis subsp. holarctica]|nr:potassium channel protein [Francisella tularensis subsp. holarctica]